MTMDLDTFSNLADAYLEQIPERFLLDAQGEPIPVIIEEKARRNKGDPPGVYILGEYITPEYLPPQVSLYYGSFVRLFRDEPVTTWEDELWETLVHEIRHHVEHMAGVFDLDREDLQELAGMWKEVEDRRRRRG